MVRSVMSMDLAVSYMQLSTSIDTALVHSSSKAYFGLEGKEAARYYLQSILNASALAKIPYLW